MAHLWMTLKIVLKTGGDVLPLGNEGYAVGKILTDFVEQEGIVSASKDNGVNEWVLGKEFVERVLYEIVGSGLVKLVVLY